MTADYMHKGYRPKGGGDALRGGPSKPNPYLWMKIQGSKKTRDNSERLGRRMRIQHAPSINFASRTYWWGQLKYTFPFI